MPYFTYVFYIAVRELRQKLHEQQVKGIGDVQNKNQMRQWRENTTSSLDTDFRANRKGYRSLNNILIDFLKNVRRVVRTRQSQWTIV
jgi:hypothetical protein